MWHPHFHLNGIKKYLTWPSLLTWRSLPRSVGAPLWAWSCRCWRWPGSCSDWAGTRSWTHGKAGLVLSHTHTHTPQSLHIPHSPTTRKAYTSWLSLHIKSWTLVRAAPPPPPLHPSIPITNTHQLQHIACSTNPENVTMTLWFTIRCYGKWVNLMPPLNDCHVGFKLALFLSQAVDSQWKSSII